MVSSQSKRYKGKINSKVCTWNAVVLDSTIGYRFVIVSQRWFTNKAIAQFPPLRRSLAVTRNQSCTWGPRVRSCFTQANIAVILQLSIWSTVNNAFYQYSDIYIWFLYVIFFNPLFVDLPINIYVIFNVDHCL